MRKKQGFWSLAVLLVFAFTIPVYGEGITWRFLGDTHIDGAQDHDKIQVGGHGSFRAVQLRVNGDPLFCQRVVVNFGNGTTEEMAIGDRISSEGKAHIIDLTGEPRVLESVELWYFKESWQQRPRVSLYGTR